jgi:hypothetical protein
MGQWPDERERGQKKKCQKKLEKRMSSAPMGSAAFEFGSSMASQYGGKVLGQTSSMVSSTLDRLKVKNNK